MSVFGVVLVRIFPTFPRIWTEYQEITQCFPLCNGESMPVLIEDKTLCGMGSFVASYFAFCYYTSRLSFILILTFYLLPGTQMPRDCYFFFNYFVVSMFVIENKF